MAADTKTIGQSSRVKNERSKYLGLIKWRRDRLAESIDRAGGEAAPYNLVTGTLLHRMFLERMSFFVIAGLLISLLAVQKYENADMRKMLEKPMTILVPSHIPDIIRIRANSVDNEAVFSFSRDIVTQLGNTNWETGRAQYESLTKYMHPTLRTRFKRDLREAAELWESRHIDQIFAFKMPTKFDRKNETIDGTEYSVFTIEFWGTTRKYVEGRPTDPFSERVILKFTTGRVSENNWWTFELLDIRRETRAEIEDNKIISR
ncbi:MAG: hypothetical protein EOP04_03640 [Proteobacteria bacterium]|nr:MAG: hypothetical protein EOP04_03640 [Pseudomonadota bacterium]